MTVVAWLLVMISYNGVVDVAVYPTEAACSQAKATQRVVWFDIRDHLCVPVVVEQEPQ